MFDVMFLAVRSRALHLSSSSSSSSLLSSVTRQQFSWLSRSICSSTVDNVNSDSSSSSSKCGSLNLQEIEKVLNDVKADNVKVIPVDKHCDWMVIATGRSTWHVKNIAQALIYKSKQKQQGADRVWLPSVQGEAAGKWVVIDSGKVIVHALDEKARAYYDLENLWTSGKNQTEPPEDLGSVFVKIRRINNSKKRAQTSA